MSDIRQGDMSKMDKQPVVQAKKKRYRGVWLWVSLVFILLTLVSAASIALGWLSVGIGESGRAAVGVRQEVCGQDMVERYNDVAEYRTRDGGLSYDQEGLQRLAQEVADKQGSEGDPTCQTIIFLNAFLEGDVDTGESTYERLQSLYRDGKYANSNLRNSSPLSVYETMMPIEPQGAEGES